MAGVYEMIEISKLYPEGGNYRKGEKGEGFEQLCESVRNLGILEPLLVMKSDAGYKIFAGRRRWVAAKEVGLSEVPCIVLDKDKISGFQAAVAENVCRTDVDAVTEAEYFSWLLTEGHLSREELAGAIGVGEATLSRRLRVLEYPEGLRDLLRSGVVTQAVCVELGKAAREDDMIRLAEYAAKGGATSGTVRDWVREANLEARRQKIGGMGGGPVGGAEAMAGRRQCCFVCARELADGEVEIVKMCCGCHDKIEQQLMRE